MIVILSPSVAVDLSSKTITSGEVSITFSIFFAEVSFFDRIEVFIDSVLQGVDGVKLAYLGIRRAKEPAQQYRLTVTGDSIRATGVLNVIVATIMGDDARRNQLVRAVNTVSAL